ncbi:hypothetical protein [Actinomadura hibisca]|uniref:hypothetical protein n=1 Tax=Actinomadura hibisca TaxID=68565 RepID=UPI00082B55A4|nr:hypothetical protein [Actinomadura hibisca]
MPPLPNTCSFPLRSVLAVTHGFPVEGNEFGAIVEHLTGRPTSPLAALGVREECLAWIYRQHPQLSVITAPPAFDSKTGDFTAVDAWADLVEQLIGTTLPIAPLPPGDWQNKTTLDVVLDHAPADKVYVIDPDANTD